MPVTLLHTQPDPVAVDPRPVLAIGRVAAVLALVSLLVGGSLMGATAPLLAAAPGGDLWAPVRHHPWLFGSAAVALAMISLFDLFTIPALHQLLRRYGQGLILIATMTAAVGDLLGILGRLVQAAEVAAASSGPDGANLLAVVEQVLNASGFLLVSVSFASFGVLMLRGFSRWLGWVGLLAGGFTAVGQLPGFEAAFYLANVAFIAWYIGLAVRLRE